MRRRDFLKASMALGAGATTQSILTSWAAPSSPPQTVRNHLVAKDLGALFFVPEKIKALQKRIVHDEGVQERWKHFLQRADNLAAGRRERSDDPGLASCVLGLAWRVTQNEAYAQRLREILLDRVEVNSWVSSDVQSRSPIWHSALDTAAGVVTCALGREALKGFLSDADRAKVSDGMLNKGVLPLLEDWVMPKDRIHALDSMGHNWWSVCISGTGLGVLASLGEDSRAAGWFEYLDTALAEFFDYHGMVLLNKPETFDPAGGFYESVHYCGYALESYLRFRFARGNVLGSPGPRIPILEKMADFFVQTMYPATNGDLAVDFGDSELKADESRAMRLLAATGFSPKLTHWYLQRHDPHSIDPLALLHLDDSRNTGENALPSSVIYPEMGWGVLRNSWQENATLLAVKSGFTWNHAHADAGSFILFHEGQPLIIDSGKCGYSRAEYLSYYCQSKAHNVVLFNGQGQPLDDFHDRGAKFPGAVHDLIDDSGVKYLFADATGPMARHFKRNYRHWLWLDGVILVYDDILAHEAGQFDWLLHYGGEAQLDGSHVQITNASARARVTMLYPPTPSIQEEKGLAPYAPEREVRFLKLSTASESQNQKFLTAIVPQSAQADGAWPKIELLQGGDMIGARIQNQQTVTRVFFNLRSDGRRMHVNSNNSIHGWDTDAYLFAVTSRVQNGEVNIPEASRFFWAGCSYLRRDGQTVFDSFSKSTAVFQPGSDARFSIKGQSRFEASLFGQPGATLSINGKQTKFKYRPVERVMRFSMTPATI
jgi:oligo-alginate lyase